MTLCYLDSNSGVPMQPAAVDAMVEWCNRGDPSGEYASAVEARAMMDTFRREIAAGCGVELEGPRSFAVVITSGAAESNSSIILSAARSYRAKLNSRSPHIIVGGTEHESIMKCAIRLWEEDFCFVTILGVDRFGPTLGTVSPATLRASIRGNTCIISIMMANNYSGIVNDITELCKVAREKSVPFHSDISQVLGRLPISADQMGLDAFSVSMPKLGGAPGVGALVIRRTFMAGFELCPIVCGGQNSGWRGGTENVPGIGASLAALRMALTDRAAKTERLGRITEAIRKAIALKFPCFDVDDHPLSAAVVAVPVAVDPPKWRKKMLPAPEEPAVMQGEPPRPDRRAAAAIKAADEGKGPLVIFWLRPGGANVLPNTIYLAVHRRGFDARLAREALERRGIIVGIGPAYNPGSKEAVQLGARFYKTMGIPESLWLATIRISVNDATTADDMKKFALQFTECIAGDECLRM